MSVILLFLSAFLPLQAQLDTFPATLSAGVQAGMSWNSVDFSPARPQQPLTGTSAGLVLRYFNHPLVGFQGELLLEQGGWSESIDSLRQYERRQTFASALILTQLSIGRGRVQPVLQVGTYLSAPIAERESLPPGWTPPEDSYYGNGLDFRPNYGLIAGTGLWIALGPIRLLAEGRYRQGLSNLIRPGFGSVSISRRTGFSAHLSLLYLLPSS